MYKWPCVIMFFFIACSSANKEADTKWDKWIDNVTITRDTYGIPHIYGKTDADAVFGLMYAQCEDNFEKVEESYLRILGRMSEKQGEAYFYQDIAMQLLYDTVAAKKDFEQAPPWLKNLLYAFSEGIHYYLYKNPSVKPSVLKKFEPWYPLLFNDGAYISANTGGLEASDLQNLFKKNNSTSLLEPRGFEKDHLTGSNGFALAPTLSASGNALLFINPHVSFYFRTEVHMVSEQGLNAYGAATWGQFFIYQGFNDALGWMHTSSLADAADLYEENIIVKNNQKLYEYDNAFIPVKEKKLLVRSLKNGGLTHDSIPVLFTAHGPVMGLRKGKFLSLRSQNHSLNGLIQSWERMKSKNLDDFTKTLSLRTNNSTNTMYADNKGNIAYWHGNFVPERDSTFNWSLPVDGKTSSTEWKGLHEINELIHIINPKNGWIQNCNSSPFFVSGNMSPAASAFPAYMAPESENFRSLRAISLLSPIKKWTGDELVSKSFDGHLSLFDSLLPPLLAAYAELPEQDPLKKELSEPIQLLKTWDRKAAITSIATTLAVFWGSNILAMAGRQSPNELNNIELVRFANEAIPSANKLMALQSILSGLSQYYSSWKIPWGEINRFQRTENSNRRFDDTKESIPVAYASAGLGSLYSYETTWSEGNKQYGIAGNSFVALVEFGPRIKAKSISTGGQSFDPSSKHFNDQSKLFLEGKLKDVFFYKEEVERNSERKYKPGEDR